MRERLNILPFVFCCILLQLFQCKKLVMMNEIFRHGARYPIFQMNGDFSGYTQAQHLKGELTLQGKHMHYLLGKIIYEKYWSQLFSGTEYLKKYHPSQIFVKSTDVNRTIQSAQSQLLGLLQGLPPYELPISQLQNALPQFPNAQNFQQDIANKSKFQVFGGINSDFHTIPIHQERQMTVPPNSKYEYRSNPYDEGDFLIKFEDLNCPSQKFWGKQNLAGETAMKIKNSDKVIKFLDALSAQVGDKIKYQQAYFFIDDYYCAKYMSRKHLALFDNPEYVKTANFIWLSYMILKKFYTQTQIKSSNTRLLQSIVNNMKQAIINNGPRLILYSAHDTTLLSLNSALKMVTIKCIMEYFYDGVDNFDTCINQYPPFASNIIFQLWEQDNLSHSVRILYNGVERKIPICNNKIVCSFADFENWALEFYIDDPNDVCGIREQYLKLYIVIIILSIILVIFIIYQMKQKMQKKLEQHLQEMQQKKGYITNFQEKQGYHSRKRQQQEKH